MKKTQWAGDELIGKPRYRMKNFGDKETISRSCVLLHLPFDYLLHVQLD